MRVGGVGRGHLAWEPPHGPPPPLGAKPCPPGPSEHPGCSTGQEGWGGRRREREGEGALGRSLSPEPGARSQGLGQEG